MLTNVGTRTRVATTWMSLSMIFRVSCGEGAILLRSEAIVHHLVDRRDDVEGDPDAETLRLGRLVCNEMPLVCTHSSSMARWPSPETDR